MYSSARKTTTSALATCMALILPCLVAGCSSSSSSSPPQEFSVRADPLEDSFNTSALEVSLRVVGKTDPNPVIHYTTDLSEPTSASPVYTGPFAISKTTVVKAIAINPDTTETDVLVKGYVLADNPFRAEWAESGHGDIAADAFRHWDEDGEVSTSCTRCHGAGGLKDYAADGIPDHPGGLAMGHDCDSCHESLPLTIYDWRSTYPHVETVEFPSLATADLYGQSNLCMLCHQGRESGLSVQDEIASGPGPYTFINIHYYAAGATFFGSETHGGYEYTEKEYVGRNNFASHEAAQKDCVGCHMRGDLKDHRLEPLVADCDGCHSGTSFETLSGSPEANYEAIQATHPQLLAAMQAYAADTLGFPIVYDSQRYPYFVHDLNANGEVDEDESGFGNRYDQFDATLLKAAYNYQAAAKDPAGYIHNGVYLRQLIHDSLSSLGVAPSVPAPGRPGFNLAQATESEQWHTSGHSDSTAEAFRHWDEDGDISASCARCHSASGFVDYIEDGSTDSAAHLGQMVDCNACHNSTNLFADSSTRYDNLFEHPELEAVEFPSGVTASMGDASNLCMTCHQGRESGVSVDAKTANDVVQAPTDYESFDFINRHYYAAAAITFGKAVTASYEYADEDYAGFNSFAAHGGERDSCLGCHMRGSKDHSFRPQVSDCSECHLGITDFEQLGLANGAANVDYDGDGMGESFDAEIKGMAANLYAGLQDYADLGLPQSSPIVYSPHSYPYWFYDTNGDGLVSPGEDIYPNRYRDFDRELLRAAFNYHSAQDPCGDIHNYRYVLQSVYDSADMLDNLKLDRSIQGTRP